MANTSCIMCNGTGKRVSSVNDAHGTSGVILGSCWACNGTGAVDDSVAKRLMDLFQKGAKVGNIKGPVMAAASEAGITSAAKSTAKMASGIVLDVVKQQAAGQLAHGMLAAAKASAGPHWPKFLEGAVGEKIALCAIPLATHLLAETYGEAIPGSGIIKTTSEAALKGISQETIQEATQLLLPFLMQVAQLGMGAVQMQKGVGAGSNGSIPESFDVDIEEPID